jgi:hypothetical protein
LFGNRFVRQSLTAANDVCRKLRRFSDGVATRPKGPRLQR